MKNELKRILVVDDEANITILLQTVLERTREYVVRTENASVRALKAATEFKPDLILLDVDMPGMGGGELASRLYDNPMFKTVPVVFLTGAVSKAEVSARNGRIGGLPFLAKPVALAEVLGCVRKHLEAEVVQ